MRCRWVVATYTCVYSRARARVRGRLAGYYSRVYIRAVVGNGPRDSAHSRRMGNMPTAPWPRLPFAHPFRRYRAPLLLRNDYDALARAREVVTERRPLVRRPPARVENSFMKIDPGPTTARETPIDISDDDSTRAKRSVGDSRKEEIASRGRGSSFRALRYTRRKQSRVIAAKSCVQMVSVNEQLRLSTITERGCCIFSFSYSSSFSFCLLVGASDERFNDLIDDSVP